MEPIHSAEEGQNGEGRAEWRGQKGREGRMVGEEGREGRGTLRWRGKGGGRLCPRAKNCCQHPCLLNVLVRSLFTCIRYKTLCLHLSRLARVVMFCASPFFHSFLYLPVLRTRYVTNDWTHFCCKLAQVIHGARTRTWNDELQLSVGQRSRSQDTEVRFGGMVEATRLSQFCSCICAVCTSHTVTT